MSDLDLSPLAIELGKWLAQNSSNGLSQPIAGDDVPGSFSAPQSELKEALAELEMEGLVELTRFIGPGIPHVRPTITLFVEFDPEVMGTDPVLDAAQLAKLVLQQTDGASVPELHQTSGWGYRRFNPALSVLLCYVDDRHVSNTLTAEYPTQHFFLDATDRVELKRFLKQVNTEA